MSRPSTSRLKANPALGMRPSLEFRRLHELQIDPSYQRTIESGPSQTLIRRIAMFWDWGLCQPLAVARRADGLLMVVDGQHRLAAARLRADIDDLPCVVTAFANSGDEAAAFVALNQQRRPLSALDIFKAALAAGDDETSEIARLITESGLLVAPHVNPIAWSPGMISNIPGVRDALRGSGAETTRTALMALANAFEGEVLRYAGTIFPGIAGFVASAKKAKIAVSLARLVETLKRFDQRRWVSEIQLECAAGGESRKRSAAKVIGREYHAGTPAPAAAAPKPALRPPLSFEEQLKRVEQGARVVQRFKPPGRDYGTLGGVTGELA